MNERYYFNSMHSKNHENHLFSKSTNTCHIFECLEIFLKKILLIYLEQNLCQIKFKQKS